MMYLNRGIFDEASISVITSATVGEIGRLAAQRLDVRRFRPNILIAPEGETAGQPELDWCGRPLRIGQASVSVEMPVVRCSMTIQPQADLPQDPSVLRTIVRHSNQNVGVYATVVRAGTVRAGDPVELVS